MKKKKNNKINNKQKKWSNFFYKEFKNRLDLLLKELVRKKYYGGEDSEDCELYWDYDPDFKISPELLGKFGVLSHNADEFNRSMLKFKKSVVLTLSENRFGTSYYLLEREKGEEFMLKLNEKSLKIVNKIPKSIINNLFKDIIDRNTLEAVDWRE